MNKSAVSLFGFAALVLAGCSSTPPKETPNPGETLIWSSADKRHEWTYREAVSEGDRVGFVAVSDKYSTEKYAREDAEQSVRKKAVQYASTRVRSVVQNVVDQAGKASATFDPDRVQREFEKQISDTGITQLKSKDWYLEKWQDNTQKVYWKAFLLAEIPKSVLDTAFARALQKEDDAAKGNQSDAEKKASIDKMMKSFDSEMEKNGR